MLGLPGLEPIDYLVIGHITNDLTPAGPQLGGTAAYAGRTAHALGLRVGIITAWGEENSTDLLQGITIVNHACEKSTTFENLYSDDGRIQYLRNIAPDIDYYHIPQLWRQTPLVHLGPVVHEVNANIARYFTTSQKLFTPQGWLREWDENGRVYGAEWPEAQHMLNFVEAVVLSEEDLGYDRARIERLAHAAQLLVVTCGEHGADLYLEGQLHHFPAPDVIDKDPTGAGDVFAAAFFIHYNNTQDPMDAVNYANQVAADSVTRHGLTGAPSMENLYEISIEVK